MGQLLLGGLLTFASKDQELKVHLVEIAIGILRADPKEDVTPARGWALDIIEKNSGVPFSQQDREALLRKPLSAKVALLGYGGIEGVDGFPGLLGAMMKKEGFPVMKLPELNQSITLSQTSGRKPRSDPEAQIVRHRKASGLKHHRS